MARARIICTIAAWRCAALSRWLEERQRIERAQIDDMWPTDDIIRLREELAEQIRALQDLAAMAKRYGCDITQPEANAQRSIRMDLSGYLGAIKEANGAAMSIGRISTFSIFTSNAT